MIVNVPAASAAAMEDASSVRVINLMVTLRLSLTLSGAWLCEV